MNIRKQSSNCELGNFFGRSPNQILMIVDEIKNDQDERRFILGRGNTPAQSVHLLKNPNGGSENPWYSLELNSYIEVHGYYFDTSKFIRFKE